MSTGKLYEEAVSEAKDLVRMAEENAKNKLIDAFTPRIRRLVESKLLSEDDSEDVMDIVNATADDAGDDDSDDEESYDSSDATMPSAEIEPEAETEDDEGFDMDDYDDDDYDVDDGMDLHVPQGVKRVTFDLEEKKSQMNDRPVEMTSESVKTLLKIVDGRGNLRDRTKALRLEAKILRRALGALNGRRPNKQASGQIVEEFNAVLRKAIGLKQELRDASPGTLAEAAKNEFNNLLEEISEMSTRTLLRNLLAESNGRRGRRLFEAEEEDVEMGGDDTEAGDDAGDEGGDEGGGEITLSPELVDMLRDALGGAGEETEEPVDDEGGDVGGDEMEEYDEGGMYEADESEMDEAEKDEADEMKHESRRRRDTVYTIDESMLRRELRRLRRLREEVEPTSSFGGDPEEEFSSYDDVELNANVKESDAPKRERKMEKDDKDAKEAKHEADKAKESAKEAKNEARRFRSAAVQEARNNRALRARLSEAAKAVRALSGQLQEQKLFNAKLLYVNKLMQNRSLSDKQLRAVVEALDAAKTLREAKLLYTSLTESLTRGKPMTEGANRTVAGSSRPTGSAGTLNESVGEVDRWAILAGISK